MLMYTTNQLKYNVEKNDALPLYLLTDKLKYNLTKKKRCMNTKSVYSQLI